MSTATIRVCDGCGARQRHEDASGRWYEITLNRWFHARNGSLNLHYDTCSAVCAQGIAAKIAADLAADENEAARRQAADARSRDAAALLSEALAEVLGDQPTVAEVASRGPLGANIITERGR